MAAWTAIAAATVLEARRTRAVWLFVAAALGGLLLARLAGALSLTETAQTQAVLLGAVLRAATVFVAAGFAIHSVAREADSGQRDLYLALAMPRHMYAVAKFGGGMALVLAAAAASGLLLVWFAPASAALAWALTLAGEAATVLAFALFCALGLRTALAALGATVAFYILARSAGSMLLLAAHAGEPAHLAARGLSAILPRLDQCARSDWLAYGAPSADAVLLCLGQCGVYIVLLGAAAAYDLQRKELT
ncbi:MAG TPA: ABC transporter permease [Telluria sp.]|nr:ABC transporter permease [Telluria sp.]